LSRRVNETAYEGCAGRTTNPQITSVGIPLEKPSKLDGNIKMDLSEAIRQLVKAFYRMKLRVLLRFLRYTIGIPAAESTTTSCTE
jgi:hypothetical protein